MANTCDQSRGMGAPRARVSSQWKAGKKLQRASEADGDGGDGGGLGYGKPRPHIEEGGCVAVGSADVDIFAAGIGQHGTELGIGHGAEEGEQAADDPGEIDERGGAYVLHHFAGDEKDAAADDGADDDGGSLAGAEDAGKVGWNLSREFGRGLTHALK